VEAEVVVFAVVGSPAFSGVLLLRDDVVDEKLVLIGFEGLFDFDEHVVKKILFLEGLLYHFLRF